MKIKAFTPYSIGPALYAWCGKAAKSPLTHRVIENFLAVDPHATEWSNLGLTYPIEDGSPVHDLDGAARMMMYQFNERILPGAVRDEMLTIRVREMSEREGRALGRKEFAQLKEDVECDLLPKAFIRRSLVPVLIYKDKLLFCTTSAVKVEKMVTHLIRLCETRKIDLELEAIKTVGTVQALLSHLARVGTEDYVDGAYRLDTGSSAVFKGEDKRTVRIKDLSVMSDEVQKIAVDGTYGVVELSLDLIYQDENDGNNDEERTELTFTLTDKFVVKGVKLSDVTMTNIGDDKLDAHATAWLFAKYAGTLLGVVVVALNEDQGDGAIDEEL